MNTPVNAQSSASPSITAFEQKYNISFWDYVGKAANYTYNPVTRNSRSDFTGISKTSFKDLELYKATQELQRYKQYPDFFNLTEAQIAADVAKVSHYKDHTKFVYMEKGPMPGAEFYRVYVTEVEIDPAKNPLYKTLTPREKAVVDLSVSHKLKGTDQSDGTAVANFINNQREEIAAKPRLLKSLMDHQNELKTEYRAQHAADQKVGKMEKPDLEKEVAAAQLPQQQSAKMRSV